MAGYLINLAEYTGMVNSGTCADARRRLMSYASYQQLVKAITPHRVPMQQVAYA